MRISSSTHVVAFVSWAALARLAGGITVDTGSNTAALMAAAAVQGTGVSYDEASVNAAANNDQMYATFTDGPPGLSSGAILTTGRAASAQIGAVPANTDWGYGFVDIGLCPGGASKEWSGLDIVQITAENPEGIRVNCIFATNEPSAGNPDGMVVYDGRTGAGVPLGAVTAQSAALTLTGLELGLSYMRATPVFTVDLPGDYDVYLDKHRIIDHHGYNIFHRDGNYDIYFDKHRIFNLHGIERVISDLFNKHIVKHIDNHIVIINCIESIVPNLFNNHGVKHSISIYRFVNFYFFAHHVFNLIDHDLCSTQLVFQQPHNYTVTILDPLCDKHRDHKHGGHSTLPSGTNLPSFNNFVLRGCLTSPSGYQPFDLIGLDPAMTQQRCVSLAQGQGRRYAGVYNDTCYGSDSLVATDFVPLGSCNTLCPGDNTLICGGVIELRRRDGSGGHAAKRAAPANVLLTLFEAIIGQPGSTTTSNVPETPSGGPPISGTSDAGTPLLPTTGPDGGNPVGPVPTPVTSPFASVLTMDGAVATVEGSVTLPGVVPTPDVTVTSLVTTVVYTTVDPSNPTALVTTELCTTLYFHDCGCPTQVFPTVSLATVVASCNRCGPGGSDVVTLTVPEPPKAGQYAPEKTSPPAPGGEHDRNGAGGHSDSDSDSGSGSGFGSGGSGSGPESTPGPLGAGGSAAGPDAEDARDPARPAPTQSNALSLALSPESAPEYLGVGGNPAGLDAETARGTPAGPVPTYSDAPSPGTSTQEYGSIPEAPAAAGSGPPESKPTQSRPGTVVVAGSRGWRDDVAVTYPAAVVVALALHFLF
ncbi:hypothetical protein CTA1_2361 [Colletotrichum tanaceti]|uniref:WSC domain-containing protein n=1 Tax=Colletotrichum tanaceti TaxID=1306861 RepID=A0A4U6XDM3_9PEZI|nr:hypothetical protein CTA1_2361 [Colletotrichum tanaceti]